MTSEATPYNKPVPVPDEASTPFFEGTKQHKLMLQKCAACGTVMWPVKPRCNNCLSAEISWIAASGKATLYSFTLVHQLYHPGFADELPYNIAEVALEEGLRITSNITDCPASDLKIGMALEVTFDDITAEVTLPRFKPAG